MLFPSGCWVSIKRCPSGETNSFFEADEKQSVPTSRLVWSKKKKFLKAFLDAAALGQKLTGCLFPQNRIDKSEDIPFEV